MDDRPTIPCEICKTPTPMLGTKLCDTCWALESQLRDRSKADKVLEHCSRPYKVGVLSEACAVENFYEVTAACEIDARVIAFIMDGGMPKGERRFEDGDRSLVEMYARIVE